MILSCLTFYPLAALPKRFFVLARGYSTQWRLMHKSKIVFTLLPLLVMACSLTAQSAAVNALPIAKQNNPATLPPAPPACQVKTGIDAGKVNLRTCGGTDCPVLIVLHEGETLTPTQDQAVNGWLAVETASGLHGWINSKYTNCIKGK